jgi:hypothetical protein
VQEDEFGVRFLLLEEEILELLAVVGDVLGSFLCALFDLGGGDDHAYHLV